MTLGLRLATGAVRGWTRFYTRRVEPSARDARRAEIESDLWEQLNAQEGGRSLPPEIVCRLVLGIPDDMRWRVEQMRSRPASVRRAVVVSVGSALLLACLWVEMAMRPAEPPQRPAVPDFSWRRPQVPAPPPPPPPPPPCNPPGIGRPAFSPCTPL
jgi:hypothetical protein